MAITPLDETAPSRARSSVCRLCRRSGGGLCGILSDSVLALQAHAQQSRPLERGTDLVHPGDRLSDSFSVVSGWLHLYVLLEDGRRQILSFVLPGEILTTMGWLEHAPFGVQALTDATVCRMSNQRLQEQIDGRAHDALRLLLHQQGRELSSYGMMTSLGRRTALERVSYLLLDLADRVSRHQSEAVDLPVTQNQIADALGLTSVHVNRVLRRLQQQGAIRYVDRRLRTLDRAGLVATAGAANDPLFAAQHGCHLAWVSALHF